MDNYSVSPKALRFDKLFVLGPYMYEKFISTGTLAENDSRLEKIGMPKIDCLRDGSLDRPMIFYHVDQLVDLVETKERERWGNETSDLLAGGRDCGTVVYDVPEMKAGIEHGLAHPGEKSEIRKDFAQKFFYNPGGATGKAVAKIYEFLELVPPN